MYIQYIKSDSYKSLFFIFVFYNSLIAKLDGNTLAKKNAIFLRLTFFVDKTAFNFHSFNKINDFVTNQYADLMYYQFYQKLALIQMRMGWINLDG